MRFLVLHVDYFRSEMPKKGRSPLADRVSERVPQGWDALVAPVSVERGEETAMGAEPGP